MIRDYRVWKPASMQADLYDEIKKYVSKTYVISLFQPHPKTGEFMLSAICVADAAIMKMLRS
ncbi:hypothetical protein D3C81_787240 [compost metagenome]